MNLIRLIGFALLASAAWLSQVGQTTKSEMQTLWLVISQLCGQLELAAPRKKQINVNGKTELRQYTSYLEGATVTLYPATSIEEKCCNLDAAGSTRTRKYGAFEFEGVLPGTYWLRVQKNGFNQLIPVRVTDNFDEKACHDSSVARSIVVDSKPPKLETRIR